MGVEAAEARRLWVLAEHVHAVTYFFPEARAAHEEAGVRGFWRGYFAGRAAPLGAVGAATVTATFFGFHPDFVARAVPEVWAMAPPDAVLGARAEGAGAALRALLADVPNGDAAEAADLLAPIAACPSAGRPLFAANAEVARPSAPWAALWHATTVLREHRGDGHVAALVTAGLDGCESHLLRLAVDGGPAATMQATRGWSDDDWSVAAERLVERGLVRADGTATDAGRALRDDIEDTTDRLARPALAAIGAEGRARLETLLRPMAERISASDRIPYPNPIGLVAPSDA